MKKTILLPALLFSLAASPLMAADPPKTNLIDHSNSGLIDEASAKAVLTEALSERVLKIHPPSRYAFMSQVEGGLNAARTCVVTARVMVLPLTATVRAPLFRPLPRLTATAFDAVPNSSTEQCRALAKDKLKEATGAIISNIIKT
jgi:hypothetical protein